jgi:hypothetical protein
MRKLVEAGTTVDVQDAACIPWAMNSSRAALGLASTCYPEEPFYATHDMCSTIATPYLVSVKACVVSPTPNTTDDLIAALQNRLSANISETTGFFVRPGVTGNSAVRTRNATFDVILTDTMTMSISHFASVVRSISASPCTTSIEVSFLSVQVPAAGATSFSSMQPKFLKDNKNVTYTEITPSGMQPSTVGMLNSSIRLQSPTCIANIRKISVAFLNYNTTENLLFTSSHAMGPATMPAQPSAPPAPSSPGPRRLSPPSSKKGAPPSKTLAPPEQSPPSKTRAPPEQLPPQPSKTRAPPNKPSPNKTHAAPPEQLPPQPSKTRAPPNKPSPNKTHAAPPEQLPPQPSKTRVPPNKPLPNKTHAAPPEQLPPQPRKTRAPPKQLPPSKA